MATPPRNRDTEMRAVFCVWFGSGTTINFLQGKYDMRRQFLGTAIALALTTALVGCGGASDAPKTVEKSDLEKAAVKIGFIKLTDIAPLVIAKEKGYFEEEGLSVTLEPQANWKVLVDGVSGGQLDAAHMLAGHPIASGVGIGSKVKIVAPLSLDMNGKGITLSNKVYSLIAPTLEKGKPVSAAALKPVVSKYKADGKPFKMGMVFPVSGHNYALRYWLAAGGLNPGYYLPGDAAGTTGAEVQLSVTPPPQMPATLEAGTIEGYSVGEPWNQAAVAKKIGTPVIVDPDIAGLNGDKVFGMTEAFAKANPKTTKALLRAIIRAQMWLDAEDGKNRAEAVKLLAKSEYVGADEKVLLASMTGKFTFGDGDTRDTPEFNMFFNQGSSYPYYSDAIWIMTQMRRWGQIAEDKPDSWYLDTAKSVYRPDLYMDAAKSLVADGKAKADAFPESDGFRTYTKPAIDGVPFDARKPSAYVASFSIGLKPGQKVTAAGVK
jgi:nitrate/nitrite transport system substrate-binding protein